MKVHFFEEFPEDTNLSPASLLPEGTRVYLAARGMEQFLEARQRLLSFHGGLEVAYWPLLKDSYWVSPFASPRDLLRMEDELLHHDFAAHHFPVMLDMELPLLRPKAFVKHGLDFRSNRRILQQLAFHLQQAGVEVLTAEYPVSNRVLSWMLEQAGVSFSFEQIPHRKIVMYYTSILRYPWLIRRIQKQLVRWSEEWGERLCVGVGCIETGIFGNEPLLTPEQFRDDLRFLKEIGIQEAVVFRLGGCRGEYWDVVREFL